MAKVALSSKNVGDIIKLTVGGAARDFVILHKGSPSAAYQGFDNTVLIAQHDVDPNRQWHYTNLNDYANSSIQSWLNGDYYNTIAQEIRNQIPQVRIPYRAGSSGTTVSSGESGLQCKIFLLSMYEVGYDTSFNTNIAAEGVKLDYFIAGDGAEARTKRLANRSGAVVEWWLRSPFTTPTNSTYVWGIYTSGVASNSSFYTTNTIYGPRPAFALPSSLFVLDDGSIATNSPPVINYSGASDLGTKTAGFTLNYTVTDPDNDSVSVTEKLSGVTKRTFSPILGATQTFQAVLADSDFQTILNGSQTLTIEATDGQASAAPVNVSFTKAVYSASITLQTPLLADAMPSAIRLNISGSIPSDVNLSIMVCNNANDTSPTWEDMTSAVLNEVNYVFTNSVKTAVNWGINFKVTVSRGPSNIGGYIYGIEGGYQ